MSYSISTPSPQNSKIKVDSGSRGLASNEKPKSHSEHGTAIPPKYADEMKRMIADAIKENNESLKANSSRTVSVTSVKSKSRKYSETAETKKNEKENLSNEFRKKLKLSGCLFKDFKTFGPKEFFGDKGAIATLRWLE